MCNERRKRQCPRKNQVRRLLLAIQSSAVTPQYLLLFHPNIRGGKFDFHRRIVLREEQHSAARPRRGQRLGHRRRQGNRDQHCVCPPSVGILPDFVGNGTRQRI